KLLDLRNQLEHYPHIDGDMKQAPMKKARCNQPPPLVILKNKGRVFSAEEDENRAAEPAPNMAEGRCCGTLAETHAHDDHREIKSEVNDENENTRRIGARNEIQVLGRADVHGSRPHVGFAIRADPIAR